ncbi:MAG TPA: SDR family NAD(P)-dependent oxidoreductase, partial [Jatrophihabitantaceae bacterium]|nr:SDR family NAD(P)-dependent oxidoreductase [Jatrophihabitantaceae bacterium]
MQSRRSRAISSLRWSLNSQTRVIARVISTRDITLITGANKGLGYETARRLIDLGHTVLVGARDPRRGTQAAHELGGVYV